MANVDDQIAYVQRILDRLFGELGAALPGMVAGLAVIVVFVLLASLARTLFRRLIDQVPRDKQPLVPNNAMFSNTVVVEDTAE